MFHSSYKLCDDQCFIFLDLHTLGILSTSQPNGLAVPDATMYPVKATSDVLHLMDVGLKNRAKGSTALNERSSRSHRFVIYLFLYRFSICLDDKHKSNKGCIYAA